MMKIPLPTLRMENDAHVLHLLTDTMACGETAGQATLRQHPERSLAQ